jgi:AAA ATPase domain
LIATGSSTKRLWPNVARWFAYATRLVRRKARQHTTPRQANQLYTHVRVQGYRSIGETDIQLGPLTVLIGPNNSGKSALLRSIYSIQDASFLQPADIHIGSSSMSVDLLFSRLPRQLRNERTDKFASSSGALAFVYDGQNRTLQLFMTVDGELAQLGQIDVPNRDPSNLFIPVLSGRRQPYYQEQVSEDHAVTISPQDSFLVSKVLPLTGSNIPEAIRFRKLCKDVLGMNFDVFAGNNTQKIGSQVSLRDAIPLEAMGAGLSGALSLVLGLSTATDKLFIIEEPEDDLHPKALKNLLDAILEASDRNQFIISTHSSIVLTRLGAVPSTRIIRVEGDGKLLPTSYYRPITERAERLEVLQDLGYGLADLDLGQGWLIFEESSAELLVRQYLSRWFAPKLQHLHTVAARGTSRVEPLFDSFREMFLFAHLEPVYRNRAWVIVDGDEAGVKLIEQLRSDFKTWPPTHFRYWPKPAFENYYPLEFDARVESVLATVDRRKRKAAKADLL